MAKDQAPAGGENLEDLESMLRELIGEDNAAKAMKFIHDCRANGAADLSYGPQETTGTLTVNPAGSRSGNAGAADNLA